MDFTITRYKTLLLVLYKQQFSFLTFQEYLEEPKQFQTSSGMASPLGDKGARAGNGKNKTIILRPAYLPLN